MLTLSAHTSENSLAVRSAASGGIVLAVAVLGILIVLAVAVLGVFVYLCYRYAPRLIKTVSPSTVNGVSRVVAFIMCIGVQIAWNGVSLLGQVC